MGENNFLDEMRERLFARRFLNRELVTRNGEVGFADNLVSVSLNNNLYSRMVNSLAWELEVPFGMISVVGPLRDFPLGEIDGFDEELKSRYGIDQIGTKKDKAGSQKTRVDKKAQEEFEAWKVKREQRQKIAFEHVKRGLETSVILACIKNDKLRDLIQESIDRKGSFSEQDPDELCDGVIEDLYDELAEMRGKRKSDMSFLVPTATDMRVNEFNEQAWQYLEDYVEPLRELIIKSWDKHSLCLLDAMTQFDSAKHQFTVNGRFVWKDVPSDIVRDYLNNVSALRTDAAMLVDGVRDGISKILALDVVGGTELRSQIDDQKYFFMKILFMLEDFIDGLTEDNRDYLTIIDVTPTGFLDYPLPPI